MKRSINTLCANIWLLLCLISVFPLKAQELPSLVMKATGFEYIVENENDKEYAQIFEHFINDQYPNLSSRVFGNDNAALFDRLYIIIDLSDLGFPFQYIFVLTKIDNESYAFFLEEPFYCTTPEGSLEDPILDIAVPTIEITNGQKLYFSGTCLNAYAGNGADREGFIHIFGHDGEQVDIYIDNLNIKTQDKSIEVTLNDAFTGIFGGAAAPIAISTDGNDVGFTAHFHIRGENELIGGAQTVIRPKPDENGKVDGIAEILCSLLDMYASPIAVRPTPDPLRQQDSYSERVTNLTFDDIWPRSATSSETYRTNGKLNLKVEKNLGTPSIDLGNANGTCTFDGGQYKLHTPRSNSMFYVCSMSICYKMMSIFGMSFYGIGSSVSKGIGNNSNTFRFEDVVINDGTFSTYPADEDKDSENWIDVVNNGWYKQYTDLRLPYNTKINGGTFNNCDVYACDASAEPGIAPQNSDGKRLCKTNIPIDETDINELGTVNITAEEYPYFTEGYGFQSLTPYKSGDNYYVYPYLYHEDCTNINTTYTHNWVTVIPLMGVKSLMTMGGNVEVIEHKGSITQNNAYMLYAQLNKYTKEYAKVSLAGIGAYVRQAISLAGNKEFSGITNVNNYEIKEGIYMMLSFNSNEWVTMVAPYDIANIYVLETTDTQRQTGESLEAFLKRQGEADGDLAQTIVTSLCPDIFSGKGSGVHMSLLDICRKQLKREPFKLIPYNPAMEGHGERDAHFYLYEQVFKTFNEDPEVQKRFEDRQYASNGQGVWDFTSNASELSPNWTYVTPKTVIPKDYDYTTPEGETLTNDVEVWMKKGRIYSFFLPSGNDKYWDGKYLIFEGYGPQELTGTNDAVFERPSADRVPDEEIVLQGNYTFHNDTITDESIYLPQRNIENGIINYEFVKHKSSEEYVNLPGQVYAVLSPANTEAIDKITREGKAISLARQNPTNDSDLQTSVPHISDASLKVYAGEQTIIMQAFSSQEVSLISIDGRVLWSGILHDGDIKQFSVAQGAYVVQAQTEITKLIVR